MRKTNGGSRRRALFTGLAVAALVMTAASVHPDSGRASPVPRVARLSAFPVAGRCSYSDTWGAPRSGGRRHEGVDIIANEGTPLVAVTDGTITKVVRDYPGSLGGNYFRLTHADGTYFTYIHLSGFAAGLGVGDRVRTGQTLGYVGSTGQTSVAHLHFEVHPFGGPAVNPTSYVTAAGGCRRTPPPSSNPTPTPPPGGTTKTFRPPVVVRDESTRVAAGTVTGIQIVGFPGLPSSATSASITVTLKATAAGRAAIWPCGTSAGLSSGIKLANTVAGTETATTVTLRPGEGGRVCLVAEAPTTIEVAVNSIS